MYICLGLFHFIIISRDAQMIQIVKSLLGVSDTEFYNELLIILSDDNKLILSSDEKDVFNYLAKEFNSNKQFPTTEVFLSKFPQYRDQLNDYEPFSITDFRYYRKQFITKHLNIYKSKVLYKMASEAAVDGITPEMAETVRKQANFDNDVVEENLSFRERYMRSMKNNAGLKTYVEQIDDAIGSIPKGAMCTLAGHTGSFKTTWAVNMAVKNALEGKNIAYISLEVAEDQLEYSILSLFSNDQRFTRMGYHPLDHQKIRKNELYEDELNFLCDVLEPEYQKSIVPNLHIVDRSRFKTYSESEFIDVLYQLDDEKPLDAIFVDHVGELALRSPLYNGSNTGPIINKYVSFFGELTVDFRKKDGKKRQVSTVLLAQTNRTGFKAAAASFKKLSTVTRPGGKNNQLTTQVEGYSTTALSDANELERFSSVVMTVFVDKVLIESHQAYVQVIKCRYCSPIAPIPVDIEPSTYKFGGDASVDESELSADLIDSLSSCDIAQKPAGTNIVSDFDDDIFGLNSH
jgi:hypothetical protein